MRKSTVSDSSLFDSSLSFVTPSGKPWAPPVGKPEKKKKPRPESLKRVDSRKDAVESRGWIVTGYSPDAVNEVRKAWHQAQDDHEADPAGVPAPLPWDEHLVAWKRATKPEKASRKPYSMDSAAQQLAQMLRKAGWHDVVVSELLFG